MATIDYSIKDIEKIVKLEGKIKNIEVKRLTAPGENFLSLVLQVDFEIEEDGHSKIVSTVAKRLPLHNANEEEKGGFDLHSNAMKNEINWYRETQPLLEDFARANGVELDFLPEFCGARCSLDSSKEEADSESILVLKNLIPEGYKNEDRYEGFNLITSKATLKKLAIFHALPIAMKEIAPQSFEILKKYLDKSLPNQPNKKSSDPEGKKKPNEGAKSPDKVLVEALATIPEIAPHMSKLKNIFGKIQAMDPDAPRDLTKEPWNTITHNDFWLNNVMVKPRDQKPPLIKIVDFQMCIYGAFAKDVVFFLLTSVQNNVIKENLDGLLRFYYDEFMYVLQKTNTNFELSYEDYLEEIRSAAAESEVGHAIFFSSVVFGEKNVEVDVLVEKVDPYEHFTSMIRRMSERRKEKLITVVSEAIKRNWI